MPRAPPDQKNSRGTILTQKWTPPPRAPGPGLQFTAVSGRTASERVYEPPGRDRPDSDGRVLDSAGV